MRTALLLFIVSIFLSLTLISSGPVQAESESPILSSNNPAVISGRVLKISQNLLYLKTTNGIKELEIPKNISLTKNSLGSENVAIKPNDQVFITQSKTGEILSVDALSGSIADLGQLLIPVMLISTLIILAINILTRESKPNDIFKTMLTTPKL